MTASSTAAKVIADDGIGYETYDDEKTDAKTESASSARPRKASPQSQSATLQASDGPAAALHSSPPAS